MSEADVRLEGISKTFGQTLAVDRLDLEVKSGEFFAILGPSGCGKTTTLRIIAGLEDPTSGQVFIGGRESTDVAAQKRNIGMVFQDYALFPHMNIADNISFGLRMRHWNKSDMWGRVTELLELIRLPGIADRYPRQLSGGEQQRVALARALAPEPAVLLLDEPLSNLDLKLRQGLRLELRRIQKELQITTIFVTHDQGEALSLSDRVVLMKKGRALQLGTPSDVYEHPRSRWVASFLGDANLFDGVVKKDTEQELHIETKDGLSFHISNARQPAKRADGEECIVAVRPESVLLLPMDSLVNLQDYDVSVGRVENFAYIGSGTRYVVRLESVPAVTVLVDDATPGIPWVSGTMLQIAFPKEKWIFVEE